MLDAQGGRNEVANLLAADIAFEGDVVPPATLSSQLDAELLPTSSGAPAPSTAVLRRGCNYSHDAMIDAIIADPTISQSELASLFGYTAGWISQVINSDAFKAKLAQRIADLRDPIITASMEEQFKGILARGLEITRAKLDNPNVSDNFVLRSMDLSAKALGYGAKKDEGRRPEGLEEGLLDLSKNLVGLLRNRKREALTLDGDAA